MESGIGKKENEGKSGNEKMRGNSRRTEGVREGEMSWEKERGGKRRREKESKGRMREDRLEEVRNYLGRNESWEREKKEGEGNISIRTSELINVYHRMCVI